MNAIRRHFPNFVDVDEQERVTVAFNTVDELLGISWVKKFASLPHFHQFSISDRHLIAEYRGGREWWVVGLLEHPVIDLPKWDHGIYEVWIDDKPAEISGHEVSVVSGSQIQLRDGRTVKRRE